MACPPQTPAANVGAGGSSDMKIVPADGIRLPFSGSGDLGTSPFFGQLSVEAIRSAVCQSTILVAHTKDRTQSPITRGTMVPRYGNASWAATQGRLDLCRTISLWWYFNEVRWRWQKSLKRRNQRAFMLGEVHQLHRLCIAGAHKMSICAGVSSNAGLYALMHSGARRQGASLPTECRRTGRRAAVVRRLFVGEGVADDLCLLPGPSNNLQALRQALTEIATWH